MSNNQLSIVRDGNHFIFLDDTGWVLIDGPWFRSLPQDRTWYVFWPPTEPFAARTDIPEINYKIIEWERVRWTGNFSVTLPVNSYYWQLYEGVVEKYRIKIGWRVKPDGRLPILMNAVDWEDWMRWGL